MDVKYYRCKMLFNLFFGLRDIVEINKMFNVSYPSELAIGKTLSIEVTLPMIPDEKLREKYVEVIKSNYENETGSTVLLGIEFAGFDDVKELSEEEIQEAIQKEKEKES